MGTVGCASAALAALALASAARADTPAAAARPEPRILDAPTPAAPRVYYGYQTLLAHAGGAAISVIGLAAFDEEVMPLMMVGSLVSTFGPALVHAAHHQRNNALASIGLNLGLPFGAGLMGMGAGLASQPSGHGLYRVTWMVIGMAIGASIGGVTAIVLDATWLGFEDEAPPESALEVGPAFSLTAAETPVVGLSLAF